MADKYHINIKERSKIFFFFLLMILFILASRLIWIQFLQNDFYKARALDQRVRNFQLETNRGSIFDVNGEELAVNVTAKTVVALPKEIENPARVADSLAGILSIERNEIEARIKRDVYLVYLERKVDKDIYESIKALDLAGVSFIEEKERLYPQNNLASHVLGFAGTDNYGLEGIELALESELKGVPGRSVVEKDAVGRSIPDGIRNYIAPNQGNDVYLTIDEVTQYYAERELKKAYERHQISGGSIIVMNPNDGSLLALANYPDFNPNNFTEYSRNNWRNRAVQDSFEPGSIFKIFTAALALENGYYGMNDYFSDVGHIEVRNEKINSWKRGGHGWQNYIEIFANSSNPAFVQVGLSLEEDEYLQGVRAYNFGNRTGIELPGETPGILVPGQYTEIEQATMSFGHGLTATPIQIASAAAASVNGGNLFQPRIIDKTYNINKDEYVINEPTRIRQVISAETSEKIRELMIQAVATGTGSSASIEEYLIGGKTGTSRHYGDEQKYDTSFVGVIPGDNPELLIYIVLYDLEDEDYYASENVVPVFKAIAENLIRHHDISQADQPFPDINIAEKDIVIDNYLNRSPENLVSRLRNRGLNVKLLGEGQKIVAQVPKPETRVSENSTVRLYLDDYDYDNKKIVVPDLRGLTPFQAEQRAWRFGFKTNGIVSGKVSSQSPEPGKRVSLFSTINIK
ncbi:MAG: penicillin-binding transpeptidase domain-containing protein [Bacillota bacterium]